MLWGDLLAYLFEPNHVTHRVAHHITKCIAECVAHGGAVGVPHGFSNGVAVSITDVEPGRTCLGGNGGSGNFPISMYLVAIGPRADHSSSTTSMWG